MQMIITERQQQILTEFSRSTQMPHAEVIRAQDYPDTVAGESNSNIVKKIGCHRNTVTKWADAADNKHCWPKLKKRSHHKRTEKSSRRS